MAEDGVGDKNSSRRRDAADAAPGRPRQDRDFGDEDATRPSAETTDHLRRPGGSDEVNIASEGALGAAGTGDEEDRLDKGRREQADAEVREQNEGD